ncbi:MAG: HIT domain-containing protein [Candidatus Nealsonbacteria bacterium]|nr:HIT domain-containing protein [Candidatus Nealsonbacteria bacterium]
MDCIFCKIANKEMAGEIIYENDKVVAFKDIYPKAAFHILIVPKKHIESVDKLEENDKELVGEMALAAKSIAKDNNVIGYKLVINVGRDGGQIVDHLHLHLLGGKLTELP